MSNETDLDWLARNVPLGQVRGWVQKAGEGFNIIPSGMPPAIFGQEMWFSAREVIARRAELQNKPRWKDAPEWASFLIQTMAGWWLWLSNEPNGMDDNGVMYFHPDANSEKSREGEVLGDWRDTLERRPTDLSEPAVTERLIEATKNVLAAVPALMDEKYSFEPEFMPVSVSNETVLLEQPIAVAGTGNGSAAESAFLIGRVIDLLRTSVDHFSDDELADLNELTCAELTKRDAAVCGGQKCIDAHWHERGELPPVGVECEIFGEDAIPEKCKIIAYHKDQVAVQWESFGGGILDVLYLRGDYWKFRPIRTERDALIEIIKKTDDTDDKIADAILAAGFSLRDK